MRRLAILAVGVMGTGLVAIAATQMVAPIISPLFDGVVVNDPYRYLSPPPGADGSPTSADTSVPIQGTVSPAFAAYTRETPPQAELLAHGGELQLDAEDTALRVMIDPIPPASGQSNPKIVGNIYRFVVTDQSGDGVSLLPRQTITLAMRSPAGLAAGGTISRFADGAWSPRVTQPSGLPDFVITNTDAFGDFAIIGKVTPVATDESPLLLVAALVASGLILLL
ncbi:MAG: hypothetical protein ACXWMN_02735, partial [Candidatus Limnocylindria bacterium]